MRNKVKNNTDREVGVVSVKTNFAAKEAYNLLKTNIFFSFADDEKCRIIGVASSIKGEGKSVTAANLAASIAETEKRTLLIDGDLRIPTIYKRIGIPASPGLSNLLVSSNDAGKAIFRVKDCDFDTMPAGDIPPNPTTLLESKRMEQLLEKLSDYYDYIIIDLPPVNIVSDALVISKYINGMVFVVKENEAPKKEVSSAIAQLEFTGVRILGIVYNAKKSVQKSYRYKYKGSYKKYYKNSYEGEAKVYD